jgi:hypothetical protein
MRLRMGEWLCLGGHGLILAGVRTSIRRSQYWNDEVLDVKTEKIYVFRKGLITPNINTEHAFNEEDLRD